MFDHELNLLISGIAPNGYMVMLFVFTAVTIITLWFAEGLLNPYIEVVLEILKYILDIILTPFFGFINWAGKKLDIHIRNPIQKAINKIHIPILMKALIYAILGSTVFALDHAYGIRIFQSDESFAMYPIEINGVKFWVSQIALWLGGFFIGLALLYTLSEAMKVLNRLLDRRIQLNILIYR